MAQSRNEFRIRATDNHEIRLFYVPDRENICLRVWHRERGTQFWQSTRTAIYVDSDNVDGLIEALTELRGTLPTQPGPIPWKVREDAHS